MAEKTVPSLPGAAKTTDKEATRTQDLYMTPPVDIYETRDGLVMMADLPGVSQDGLGVEVDNHLLTIQGMTRSEAPGEVVYREYELANFYRQFEISDRINSTRISAELNHGVLKLTLPKAEEAKSRKIEVKVT
jgi:HSP20 family molecular chaperone IbpA